ERIYSRAARRVASGEVATLAQTLPLLREMYPTDEQFRTRFATKIIKTSSSRNARIVRYILQEMEHHSSNQQLDFESGAYSIEHILPQNAEEGWDQFTENELEAMTWRLGNMVVMERAINRDLGN